MAASKESLVEIMQDIKTHSSSKDDDPIQAFSKKVKTTRSPNLFTILEVRLKGKEEILKITAADVIADAKEVTSEMLNKPHTVKGNGSKIEPYIPVTLQDANNGECRT